MLALTACGVIERITGEAARKQAREEEARAWSQTEQQKVMRFADEFVERVVRATEVLASGLDQSSKVALYDWQLAQATAAIQVAAGANPTTNAVDMVVLVSLNRRIVEASWIDRYGEAAAPVLQSYQSLEQDAWRLVADISTEQTRAELDLLLSQWIAENPEVETAAYVRFADFASFGPKAQVRVSPGLLGIVGLDPLEGIDPAVREFERTRILAERALYYAQRLPNLLDIQMKLTGARIGATPEANELVETVAQVRELSSSLDGLARQTPALVAREREAAIAQFMAALEIQNEQIRGLAVELKGALEAGALTAQSLDQLVHSADALVARFEREPAPSSPGESGRPFDINEYTRAISELASTARELQALIRDADNLTPALAGRIGQLTGQARELIDFVFSRVLLVILAILLAALAYRLIASRLTRAS